MVVGAGVVGLSVAVHLAQRFSDQLQVTVVADKFSPDTTGDKAGTIILPLDWSTDDAATSTQNKEQLTIQNWSEITFQK